ncbi:DUF1304 domain-containing protein [Simiduia curdlanivorans]|uniref:DUF1304 domain-containing protein n=1 Tax=Simiduia curdlanivorans TaxID=1492769 RepID=A0ABV8V057_9GAMM|nr:DUF1304 domain-containing protein [Simiduia curdlanivorans]MDN3637842.1 DUF1304 domain-containing protein [Simiduia curdlanivorans]
MLLLANILVAFVALLHLYFLALEMFFWDKPLGLKVFGQSKAQATTTKVLAANQGLYNGFLAAGLILGLLQGSNGTDFKLFFLSCIVVAGLHGAMSVSRKIFFIQALPAICALCLLALVELS